MNTRMCGQTLVLRCRVTALEYCIAAFWVALHFTGIVEPVVRPLGIQASTGSAGATVSPPYRPSSYKAQGDRGIKGEFVVHGNIICLGSGKNTTGAKWQTSGWPPSFRSLVG